MSTGEKIRCQCLTDKKVQCGRMAKAGSEYCWQHQDCTTPVKGKEKGPLRAPSPVAAKITSPRRVQVLSERSAPSPRTPSPLTPSVAKRMPAKPVLKKPAILSPRKEVGTVSRISPPKVSPEKRVVPAAPLPKKKYDKLSGVNLEKINKWHGNFNEKIAEQPDEDISQLVAPQKDLTKIRIKNPVIDEFTDDPGLPKVAYDNFIILENPTGIPPIDILRELQKEWERVQSALLELDPTGILQLTHIWVEGLIPKEDEQGPYYEVKMSS